MSKDLPIKRCCITPADESQSFLKKAAFKKFRAKLLVGVGGLGNIEIMLTQCCENVLLCDFDPNINDFWRIFSDCIKRCSDQDNFLTMLQEKMIEERLVCANISASRATEDEKFSAVEVANYISQQQWFKDDEKFNYVRNLFAADPAKIEIMNIDFGKDVSPLVKKIEEYLLQNTEPSPPKVAFNFMNMMDFILGRTKSDFMPNAEHGAKADNATFDQRRMVVKSLCDFLESQDLDVLVIDACYNLYPLRDPALLDETHPHFHTNLLFSVGDFRATRRIDGVINNHSGNEPGQICAILGESRTASVQRVLGDEESFIGRSPRCTIF